VSTLSSSLSFNTSLGPSNNVSAHVLAKISPANAFYLQQTPFCSTEQRVNERVTVLTHEQMVFNLGSENVMEPD
jgi:hypothetical protein